MVASTSAKREYVAEILRCGKDPKYFMKRYCKVQHPVEGLVEFETYPFQDDCIDAFEKHRFNIVLKARQLGLSTVTAAYCAWLAIFHREKNILVIATKLPAAQTFVRKVKTIIKHLPQWLLLPKVVGDSKGEVEFDNGSKITATATSENAGRSDAVSLLIIDEAAWIPTLEDLWTGLFPTLSTGGRAILISTPNGVGGIYYRLWQDAEAGLSDFNTIRLMWNVHPERDETWFNDTTRNFSPRKIAQEYMCEFLGSGDTFLNADVLAKLRDQITEPREKSGLVWIWHNPHPTSKYVLTADVARGDGGDYSTFHIFEVVSGDMCAEFMGKMPPDHLGQLIDEWGRKYNDALVCPENNTYGYMTCVKLKELKYPRMYYEKNKGNMFEYVPASPNELPGFNTGKSTRNLILSHMEEAFRNDGMICRSRRLYEQLASFSWVNGKAQALADAHDDLVMSAAIASWLVFGSGKASDEMVAHSYALLAATSRTSVPLQTQDQQPFGLPQTPVMIMGHRYNVNATIGENAMRDVLDYSWLTRR